MEYLLTHAYAVHGRSGEGYSGFCRLSNREFVAYAERIGWEFEPWEADAVFALDHALIAPGDWEGDRQATGVPDVRVAHEPHRPPIPVIKQRPDGVEPQFTRAIPT